MNLQILGGRNGAPNTCGSCRFWSEMIAKSEGGGPVQAMCLAESGPHSGHYTTGRDSCASWKHGELGAIDAPADPEEGDPYADEEEDREPGWF